MVIMVFRRSYIMYYRFFLPKDKCYMSQTNNLRNIYDYESRFFFLCFNTFILYKQQVWSIFVIIFLNKITIVLEKSLSL